MGVDGFDIQLITAFVVFGCIKLVFSLPSLRTMLVACDGDDNGVCGTIGVAGVVEVAETAGAVSSLGRIGTFGVRLRTMRRSKEAGIRIGGVTDGMDGFFDCG